MNLFFEDGDRVQCYQGDCLEVMPRLEGQFDMILADLPYGITALKTSWDVVIPFEPIWECYKRLIKPNGSIVLFGSQPFTSALVMSNPKWFRHSWIWNKNNSAGFATAKIRPLTIHEDVLVFGQKGVCYYPQMESRGKVREKGGYSKSDCYGLKPSKGIRNNEYYPKSILNFGNADQTDKVHPTQKPIDLLSYLIKTYTLAGEKILDNTAGSFSTGVAAVLNGRQFVGIERESKYCEIGQQRIEKALQEVDSMLIKPWEVEAPKDDAPVQPSLFAS